MKWRRSKWIHWIHKLNFQKYMDSYKRWIHQKNSWKQWIHLNDEKLPNDRNMWIHLKGEFIKIKTWKQWIHLNNKTWRNPPTTQKPTVNHGKQERAILVYWKKPLKTMWDTLMKLTFTEKCACCMNDASLIEWGGGGRFEAWRGKDKWECLWLLFGYNKRRCATRPHESLLRCK